jgi:nicotinamide riboside kinase
MARIVLIGSHGTGKTSLANRMAQELGLPEIKEVARGIISEAGYRTTAEYKAAPVPILADIQRRILIEQMRKEVLLSSFISDRSVIDIAAYTLYYTNDNVYSDLARDWANRYYDLIIYVPIMFRLQGDGFRDEDEKFQFSIDDIIREQIEKITMPVYELRADTINRRIQEVKTLLEKLHGETAEK